MGARAAFEVQCAPTMTDSTTTEPTRGAYGADDDIADYILGITYEIWEQRRVGLIHQYYTDDCKVYGLDGIVTGSQAVVDGTLQTLASFPDRPLMADNVIWSGNREQGFYSSHRLTSHMTNTGATLYGGATNRRVRTMNIADCVVEDGRIVREWLARDTMTLVQQLGFDPVAAARTMAASRTAEHRTWLAAEIDRVGAVRPASELAARTAPLDDPERFAWRTLVSAWANDAKTFFDCHAPYSVLQRSPVQHFSGREAVLGYYAGLAQAIGDACVSVDHVAALPFADNGVDIAVRWTASGIHSGRLHGIEPTQMPVLILAITHWRCLAGRIVAEWTIFDDVALLSQVLDA